MDFFPYSESHFFEFKETLISSQKLYQCICAFLNGSGGHLILGIRDRDLKLCGLSKTATVKEIDTFMLKCDNIYHQGFILTADGKRLDPTCIRASLKYLSGDRKIIWIRIQPTLNTRYVCFDGMQYVRLSASNFKITGQEYYNPDILRNRTITSIRENYTSIIYTLKTRVDQHASKLMEIQCELQSTTHLLFQKILADKANMEKQLRARHWLLYILCC